MRRTGPGTGARLAAAVAAIVALWATPAEAQPSARRDPRATFIERFTHKPAPPFTLKDVSGGTVSLSQFRGKVVLLNFWFSACFPCRAETPDLIQLHALHKDKGLVILGINTDDLVMPGDGGTARRKFIETFKIPYSTLVADDRMYRAYGSTPIQPISFLIDRNGDVAHVFWGAIPGAAFERLIKPHLAAAPRLGATPARPRVP